MFIERPLNMDCTIVRWWDSGCEHFTIITGVEEFYDGGLYYAVIRRFRHMLQPKYANYFIERFCEEMETTGILPATFAININTRMKVK